MMIAGSFSWQKFLLEIGELLFIIKFRWVLNPLIFAAQNQKKPINAFLKILTSNDFNQGENTFNSAI